jgi:hypothetical protein
LGCAENYFGVTSMNYCGAVKILEEIVKRGGKKNQAGEHHIRCVPRA